MCGAGHHAGLRGYTLSIETNGFMQQLYKQLAKSRERKLIQSMSTSGIKRQLLRTASALALMIGLHTGAMVGFEGLSLGDAFWLTMTTVATVGYGDLSASSFLGRAATIGLMYGAGITLLAQTAGLVFEARQIKRDKVLNGKWKWNMDNHIVILGSPKNSAEGYFKKMISTLRSSDVEGAQSQIAIVCPDMTNGMPEEIRKMGVAHVNEPITSRDAFDKANVKEAKTIIVMCKDPEDPVADSVTLDLVARAREQNPTATIIAESISDDNRRRLKLLGADQVMRPIRAYPEMLVRAVLAPGAETVMEDLFDADGEEVKRYNVSLKGTWGEVAARLITSDVGMPLSYVDQEGKVISNQHPGAEIDAQAVLVVVREGNIKKDSDVQNLMDGTSQNAFAAAAANLNHAAGKTVAVVDAAVEEAKAVTQRGAGFLARFGFGKKQ